MGLGRFVGADCLGRLVICGLLMAIEDTGGLLACRKIGARGWGWMEQERFRYQLLLCVSDNR